MLKVDQNAFDLIKLKNEIDVEEFDLVYKF